MWNWTLNWSEIRDDLVVGACPMSTDDIDAICTGTGASALLSVQHDECRDRLGIDYDEHVRHGRRTGVVLANAPMRDFDPPEQRLRLPDAVRELYQLLAASHKVYVHCTAGINRSPLTILAYLAFVEGMATDRALQLIRRARPQAEPYWESFEGCRDDLLESNRSAIERRARHLSQGEPGQPPEAGRRQAEQEVIRELFVRGPVTSIQSGRVM